MSSSGELAKAMLLNNRPIVIDESDIIAKGFINSMKVESLKMDRPECSINFIALEFNIDEMMTESDNYMIVRIRHG